MKQRKGLKGAMIKTAEIKMHSHLFMLMLAI